jgi:putative Mn2+ efflux pump MntP
VLLSVRLAAVMVNLLTTVVLGFSMSADAFAAALGKGAALERLRLSEALRTGVVFGTIEAITPVIGWAVGLAASGYITAIDHWIAFTLLGGIGGKMINLSNTQIVELRTQVRRTTLSKKEAS